MGGGRWNPWRDLRARDHIDLEWAYLDSGRGRLDERSDGRRRITLDARLGRLDRCAVLGHELVHDERDGGCDVDGMPDQWAAVVARDEAAVDSEVARRLVPLDELGRYIRRRVDSDLVVTVPDVADEFDVALDVARNALHLFARAHV